MATDVRGRGGVWPRLLFLGLVALGVVLYRGGFGLFATERTLTWRLPVAAAEVRRLDLQVWADGQLARREELSTPGGLTAEPTTTVALSAGAHEAIATVWLEGPAGPRTFRTAFDPRGEDAVLLSFR